MNRRALFYTGATVVFLTGWNAGQRLASREPAATGLVASPERSMSTCQSTCQDREPGESESHAPSGRDAEPDA